MTSVHNYESVLPLLNFMVFLIAHVQPFLRSNMLLALDRGTMSSDPLFRPAPAAVQRVLKELTEREQENQDKLLSLLPLVG